MSGSCYIGTVRALTSHDTLSSHKVPCFSLSLRFNGHFPGEPGLAEAKDDGGVGDNWNTGAISLAKLQSNHHHQQTNIQLFTGRMPSLSPNQQCQRTEGKSTEGFLCSTEEKCDTPIGSMQTDPVNLNCTK